MTTNFSSKLLVTLLALGLAPIFFACKNEKPPTYVGGPTKQSTPKIDETSPAPGATNKPSADASKAENSGSGKEAPLDPSPNKQPQPKPKDGPTPMPPPVPNPEPDAALKAACKPAQIEIVDQDNGATTIFKSAISDPQTVLAGVAQSDCLSLYKSASEFRSVKKITITIKSFDGVAFALPGQDSISFSSDYIKQFASGKNADAIKQEMYGVMTHEINHLYQNFWKDGKYTPLSEGICDAIRGRAGYYPSNRKQKGGTYLDSYTTTGYFILYLDETYPGFIYKMNGSAKTWNDDFWQKTTGKAVDQLWKDYQQSF